MVVLFKEIKPARLREDKLRLELLNAIRKVGRATRREYEATTEHWKHKVKFEMLISLKDGPTALVETGDEIYGYVDEGTKPYVIRPKRSGGVLAFPSVSVPKTKPGSLKSGRGKRGGPTIFTREVHHPGTKARDFTGQIKKKMLPRFKREMEKAMVKAAKKSGHAI